MSAYRQAALLVHGLGEEDRAWMLGQLAPAERDVISAQLAELRELGIPPDAQLLKQAIEVRTCTSADSAPTVGNATATQMGQVLKGEPVWFQQHVLSLDAWPWAESFLEQSAIGQARQADGRLDALKGPKFEAAMRARLEARLKLAAREHPVKSTRFALMGKALAPLRKVVRQWL